MLKALIIAVSGGVDSSAAAHLLVNENKKSGYFDYVAGASHFIWPLSRCCDVTSLDRAKKTCSEQGIPYHKIYLTKEFSHLVVRDFLDTYTEGKTPNPCVLCNQSIRFDLFYEALKKQLAEEKVFGEDFELYLSTGHYARIEHTEGRYFIRKGKDPAKDQSYMLYRIPAQRLPYLIFPLGGYSKDTVKQLVREWGMNFALNRDSQDACFVEGNYADFIVGMTGNRDLLNPGPIVDTAGHKLGHHQGYIRYTIGQRRGLDLSNGPWYVSRIVPATNTVVVSRRDGVGQLEFFVDRLNWFAEPLTSPVECTVKIRYQSREQKCCLDPVDKQSLRVTLSSPDLVTPGQSAVFYHQDLVWGGGIIR